MAVITEKQECEVKFAIAFQFTPKSTNQVGNNKWTIDTGVPWNVKDVASTTFANELDHSFNGRAKTYTNLSSGRGVNNSLAAKLHEFNNKSTPSNKDFLGAMSSFVSSHLKSQLNNSQLKSGFIVTAVLYESYRARNGVKIAGTESNILNISMIRASEALQFDSKYRITKVPAIDFSNLLQSARIDVDIFKSNISSNPQQEHSDMCFIAGQGGVRDYFFNGLGALNYVKNKDAADNLINGLNSFLDSLSLNRSVKISLKDSMHSFIASPRNRDGVLINDLESYLDSHLPASHTHCKGELKRYLTKNDYPVNEKVVLSSEQRNTLVWVDININSIQVKFRLDDIGRKGVNSNSSLKFDASTDILSFEEKVTDADVIAEIKRALKG
ncbi:hypothetical protein CWE09_04600 [Aliidiomarina minuta]|uniref:Nucleoid-associated protein n=1 Tax=Aliidiomarina minuta TaxID=880057 RepID=A0A432W7N5_9GAMM|nr:nucleoid-associated protein [Aliidiomarina minuta]RUO26011.1 hypothetical protein CWE09_04600 [Aliidiomarina minuta]